MKRCAPLIICLTLLCFGAGPVTEALAYEEPWQEFAHPANPHAFISYRPAVINDLFATTGDATVTVPVLVVLLEFQNLTHRADHTLQYWEDLVFGNPRNPNTFRPSIAEIVRENSNGRLLLVPALNGDTADGRQDGIIGWVRSQHRTDDPYWTQDGLLDEGPMRGRAEGIIAADPSFNYYFYDGNGDGLITNDELLILVIFADNITLPECGNRRLDPGEQCDDGNMFNLDGCFINCLINPLCGNGVQDTYEECDDGNNVKGDGCSLDCKLEGICGNGLLEAGEECDDGNVKNADGCSSNCFKEITCDQHVGHTPVLPAGTTACIISAAGNARAAYDGDFYVSVDQDTQNPVDVYQLVAGDSEVASEAVVIHEAGHTLFGLGDLYVACDSNRTTVDNGYYCNNNPADWFPPTPDIYSTMDIPPGSWPPLSGFVTHFSPWAKIHLGFVKPLVVTHDGTYSLSDAETEKNFSLQLSQPEALIIYDPLRGRQEYFILENRNITGLPAGQSAAGLAVWLINENKSDYRQMNRFIERGGYNVGNNVSLWDGINDTEGYDFTDASGPRDTKWTDGTSSFIEITEISPAGPSMTFKVTMPPVFVDKLNTGTETGSQANPFNTVGEAVNAIPEPPRTIRLSGGSYPGAITISKPCTLKGWRNGDAIIGSYQ